MREGRRRIDRWLDLSNVWAPDATDRHRALIGEFRNGVASSTKLVADAQLAALAIEHGLTLCSTDGDFARFPGLRWENPLARFR